MHNAVCVCYLCGFVWGGAGRAWWTWWLAHKGQEGGGDSERWGWGGKKRRLVRGERIGGAGLGQAGTREEAAGVVLVQGHGNLA